MGVDVSLSIQEGQIICESIYETFGDIMLKLKIQHVDLTKEDLLHCAFFCWVALKKQSYYVHVLLKEHLKVGKVV